MFFTLSNIPFLFLISVDFGVQYELWVSVYCVLYICGSFRSDFGLIASHVKRVSLTGLTVFWLLRCLIQNTESVLYVFMMFQTETNLRHTNSTHSLHFTFTSWVWIMKRSVQNHWVTMATYSIVTPGLNCWMVVLFIIFLHFSFTVLQQPS